MGFLHINNLYKDQRILLFKECYALEKIHGTSAHVAWKDGALRFFSGGEKHDNFVKLFDHDALVEKFASLGHESVIVYGEAYGGKQQKQSWRYGSTLRFVAFDVKIDDAWLDVSKAEIVANQLGIEFVSYRRVSTDLAALDAARDMPSVQAQRNGVEGTHPMEGVVLRPLIELCDNRGERIIAKHKRDEERETRSPRPIDDPEKLQVLAAAEAIALEWVTQTRLEHVLDKLNAGRSLSDDGPVGMEDMRLILEAMVEDVVREGSGEFVDTREARRAISTSTAKLFKQHLKNQLRS